MASAIVFVALAVVVGAVVGSLITTAAMRIAVDEGWVAGRSACDTCRSNLGYAQTVPILSFVTAGGRCFNCRAPIDWRHPVGEIVGAGVGLYLATNALDSASALKALLILLLLFISVFDISTLRIPDIANLGVAAIGAALAFVGQSLVSNLFVGIGALALANLARFAFARKWGQEGLGGGDVKLMAALAVGEGPTAFCWTLVVAAGLALLWFAGAGKLRFSSPHKLAFGPFLALGWAVVVLAGRLA